MNYRRGEFIRDERRPFSLLPSSYYARVTTKSNTKRELRIGFDRSFEFDHAFNLFTDDYGYFEDEKLISGLSIVEGASLTYRSATTGRTIIDKKSFELKFRSTWTKVPGRLARTQEKRDASVLHWLRLAPTNRGNLFNAPTRKRRE